MKRVFVGILAAALVLSTAACTALPGAAETPGESAATLAQETAEAVIQIEPDTPEAQLFTPDGTADAALPQDTPAAGEGAETDRALEGMRPVLDSVMRTVGYRCTDGWRPEDPAALWPALYAMGVNFLPADSRVTLTDDACVSVPAAVLTEWAAALGEGVTALPALPADVDYIRYDAAQDAYLMNLSDAGDSETQIESYHDNGDGTYTLRVGLYMGDGERLGALDFVLAENPAYAAAAGTPAYAYCVRSVTAAE